RAHWPAVAAARARDVLGAALLQFELDLVDRLTAAARHDLSTVESKFDLAPVELNIQDRTADVRAEYGPQLPLQLLGDEGRERCALGVLRLRLSGFDVVLAFPAPQPTCLRFDPALRTRNVTPCLRSLSFFVSKYVDDMSLRAMGPFASFRSP